LEGTVPEWAVILSFSGSGSRREGGSESEPGSESERERTLSRLHAQHGDQHRA